MVQKEIVRNQNFMHPVLPTAKDVFCSFCYQNENKNEDWYGNHNQKLSLEGLPNHV